jgi:hypothetical protein
MWKEEMLQINICLLSGCKSVSGQKLKKIRKRRFPFFAIPEGLLGLFFALRNGFLKKANNRKSWISLDPAKKRMHRQSWVQFLLTLEGPPGVKFAPIGELGPQWWTLSPRSIAHPFVYAQGWTLSNV